MKKIEKILFIVPRTDRPIERIEGICPPLGILYLCTFLKKHGIECKLLDMYAKNVYVNDIRNEINEYKPDIVGLSMMFSEAKRVGYAVAEIVKSIDVNIIVYAGGVDATFRGKKMLEECSAIDYCIRYDGEETILELKTYLEKGVPVLESINSLIYRSYGQVRVNAVRSVYPIEKMPVIDRSFYNSEDYFYPYTLITSKGCPYSCVFCGGGAYGRGYQLMPLENVENEVISLRKKIESDGNLEDHHVIIWDDAFTVNVKRSIEVAKIMHKYGLKWGAQGRVNEVTKETLDAFKKNGCQKLNFGVESADEAVLEQIHKNIYLSQVMFVAHYSEDHKLPTSFNFIIPLPTDTYESASMTLDFAAKLDEMANVFISINMNTLFPGTEMYENMDLYGIRSIHEDEQYNSFTVPSFYTEKLSINEINELASRAFIIAAKSRMKRNNSGIKY